MRAAVYCCFRFPLASATCTHAPSVSRTDSCEPNLGPEPERSCSESGVGITSSVTGAACRREVRVGPVERES